MIAAVGGALVDVRATTGARWVPGRSLPGDVRLLAGGGARNVAVDLAHFGHAVTLLTAVGADPYGEWILSITAAAGVDVTHVLRVQEPTGMFVTIGPVGGSRWCVADARAVERLSPADVVGWHRALAQAACVVSDANLSEATHQAVAAMARGRRRVLLAISAEKAGRLRPVLSGAAVLVCNRDEAAVLGGCRPAASLEELGSALRVAGVARVVLTAGEDGVLVITDDGSVYLPAAGVPIIDATGAGDAVAAVSVHALVRGLSASQTAALAVAAAAVVVQSQENTPAALAVVGGRILGSTQDQRRGDDSGVT